MLKLILANLDGLDKSLHGLYEAKDGAFHLKLTEIEGYQEARTKVDEFRSNNTALLKERDDLKKALEPLKDLDPAEYAAALKKLEDIDDSKLMEVGKVEEVIATRTEKMRADLEGQITALTTRAEEAEGNATNYKGIIDRSLVNDAITTALMETIQPKQGAMNDVLSRAAGVWFVDKDGKLQPKNAQGDTLYSKNGTDVMTPKEWVEELQTSASHLFEPNTGGGAGGTGSGEKKTAPSGANTVSAGDSVAFSANLEGIAKGDVTVVD